MTARKPIPHDGGPCPVPDMTPVRPVYRGPENHDRKGHRITFTLAARLYWPHVGGNDDIVAYYIENVP